MYASLPGDKTVNERRLQSRLYPARNNCSNRKEFHCLRAKSLAFIADAVNVESA